jgi:hypothetical protein
VTSTVTFHRPREGPYHSVLLRPDGVSVALRGGGFNRIGGDPERVPHDIAHLVVEEAFALPAGLWGVLASGGLVQNAEFAGGRRPPHARQRARAVTARAGESLRQAEILVRAVADAMLEGTAGDRNRLRARVGERWWSPTVTPGSVAAACEALRDAAVRWDALPPGGSLVLAWSPPRPAAMRRR